jgi:hypothetical protein
MFVNERNDKTSQYKGVSYKKQTCKWVARFHLKGHTPKYGGQFNNEEDAGKKVNQICKEFGIPPYNPEIGAIPNEGYEVTKNFVCINLPFQFFPKFFLYTKLCFKLYIFKILVFFPPEIKF